MNIVLVHGENKQKVQERVKSIVDGVKKRGWKIERADKNTSLSDIFTSNTLLPETKLCILEGVANLSSENINWLEQHAENTDGSLLLIHNGDAPKRPLTKLKKYIKEEHFPLPQILFKYLESLKPGNAKASIKMLHEMVATESIELISAMMARHFRDLLWVKSDSSHSSFPDWRKNKLQSQVNSFPDVKLNHIISEIADADYQSKSGGMNLITSIDLIIVRELS